MHKSNPLRVLQVLPELNSGGVERGTLEVGKFLIEQGHESMVISNGGRLVQKLEQEGSRHITLPVHKKSLTSLRLVQLLREIIEKESPDIVHFRSRLPAWIGWLAWRKMNPQTRPRLVTTFHGFYSINHYSKIMTTGEVIICVSESIKQYILNHFPKVSKEKLNVIHRGVDTSDYYPGYQPSADWRTKWKGEFPQTENKYLVTLPGRITRWKGQLDLLKIITELKQRNVPAHGLIGGEPHPRKFEYFNELKAAILQTGLKQDITLVGHRSDIREVLAISDVVLSLSTDPEAFGRASLEALSLGKPVAGYDHGGVKEQLDAMLPCGKVPVGNTNQMCKLLDSWYKNPVLPTRNNPFTLAAMVESTLAVYQELTHS